MKYLPHIVLALFVLSACEITFRIVAESDESPRKEISIPEDLVEEYGPTRIRLRQLERADSNGMFIVADSNKIARWTDSVRLKDGKLLVGGDSVRVYGDGILCTGSFANMLEHYPAASDSCQMFLVDSTNLLFNYDYTDSTWHSVYQDLLIIRNPPAGWTYSPAKPVYFDETTNHFELAIGDSLPTHVLLSLDPDTTLSSFDWYVIASAGRYPKRIFPDWPTLADGQYYFDPGDNTAGNITLTPTKDSIQLFRQDGLYIYVNVQSNGGVVGGGGNIITRDNVTAYLKNGSLTGNDAQDVVSGSLIPVVNRKTRTDTVALPVGFSFDLGFDIWKNGDGYSTSIDDLRAFRDSFLINGKAYYVDGIIGSDNNDGLTSSTPLKTISKAATKTDLEVIYLAGGIYPNGDFQSVDPVSDTLAIIGYNGSPIVGDAIEDGLSWQATSMTGVYMSPEIGYSSARVINPQRLTAYGIPEELETESDTTGVGNNPGSFYFLGDTLFVHTHDSQQPSPYTNCIVVTNDQTFFGETQYLYVQGISFIGRVSADPVTDEGYLFGCNFYYNRSSDHVKVEAGNWIFNNCRLFHSVCDGWNYENATTSVELNCFSRYAGLSDSGRCQNSTGHDSSKVVRINCDYGLASDECAYDVGTYSWIVGGRYGGEWLNTDGKDQFIIGHSKVMWIDGAKIGGNSIYDIGGDGTIYVRNISLDATLRLDDDDTTPTIKKY